MQQIDALFWQELDHPDRGKRAILRLPNRGDLTLLDLPPSQLQFLRRLANILMSLILHYNLHKNIGPIVSIHSGNSVMT